MMKFNLLFLLSMSMISAPSGCSKQIPVWRGNIYVGNYLDGSIQRKQAGEVLSTRDPRFGSFFCIEQAQFDCFFKTYIESCEHWVRQESCGLESHGN